MSSVLGSESYSKGVHKWKVLIKKLDSKEKKNMISIGIIEKCNAE